MKKYLMVTESQISALLAGQSIVSRPLPFNPDRDDNFVGAKGPDRFVETTCRKVGPGEFELTAIAA